MVKRKLKKKAFVFFIVILLLIAIPIAKYLYQDYVYKNSTTYKLLKHGYNEDEIEVFNEKLSDDEQDKLLLEEKNVHIVKILQEKYYLAKNLESYLAYLALHPDTKYSDVIAIVNVKANYDWYDEKIIGKTDMAKGDLILVNKFNALDENYVPEDLEIISNDCAYSNNQVRKHVKEYFTNMCRDAKKEGIALIASSSYRSYEIQKTLFARYIDLYGIEYTLTISARPGHSEHQTGYTIDILTHNTKMADFSQTNEYKWLQNHAHEYGFILRYPEGKEYITGYAYESWHYRFVGIETATKIYNEDITFDEYYAYYLDK